MGRFGRNFHARGEVAGANFRERANEVKEMDGSGQKENTNTVLGEAGQWGIKWEDLRIGERIGIGKKILLVQVD